MTELNPLVSKLRLDASGFTGPLHGAQAALGGFQEKARSVGESLNALGATMRKVGAIATAAFTLPIIAGATKAIMAASDLVEAQSAVDQVYDESGDAVKAWADDLDAAYGISETNALTAVTTQGQLYKAFGYTDDAAAGMSERIVEAAGDLASFRNEDPTVMLESMQSALVGEYDSLQRYGIVLTEATVAQKAMEMTGKTTTSMLTEQDKVAARHALILDGMGAAQGDAIKTSKTFAGQLRILRKRFADLTAHIGEKFLPIALKLIEGFGKVFSKLEELSPGMVKFGLIVAAVAAAIGPLMVALGILLPGFVLLLSPIGLVAVALGGLVAIFPGIRSAIKEFADALIGGKGLSDALRAIGGEDTPKFIVQIAKIIDIFGALKDAFTSGESVDAIITRLFGPQVRSPLSAFATHLLKIADAVGDLVAAFRDSGFSGLADVFIEEIGNIADELGSIVIDVSVSIGEWIITQAVDLYYAIKQKIAEWLGFGSATALDGTNATAGMTGGIPLGTLAVAVVDWAVSALVDLGTAVIGKIAEWWPAIKDNATSLIGKVVSLGEWVIRGGGGFAEKIGAKIVEWWGLIKDTGQTLNDYLIKITFKLSDDIDWDGAASSIGTALVEAITGLTGLASDIGSAIADKIGEVDWGTVVTADSFDVGVAFGAALGSAIGAAANIVTDVGNALKDLDWSTVPGKIAEGIKTALKTIGAVSLGLNVAIASFIGGAISGLVFGPDADFGSVVTKIKDGITGSITADKFAAVGTAIAQAIWDAIVAAAKGIFDVGELIPGGGGANAEAFFPWGMGGDKPGSDLGKSGEQLRPRKAFAGFGAGFTQGAMQIPAPDTKAFVAGMQVAQVAALTMRTTVATALTGLAADVASRFGQAQQAAQQRSQAMQQGVTQSVQAMRAGVGSAVAAMAADITSRFAQATQAGTSQVNALRAAVVAAASAIGAAGRTAGDTYRAGIVAGFAAALAAAQAGVAQIRAAAASIGSLYGPGFSVGSSLGQGIAAGMQSWAAAIASTAANLVNQAIAAARSAAAAHSPSRKMMALGDDLIAGLHGSLLSGQRSIADAMAGLVAMPTLADPGFGAMGAFGGGHGFGGDVHNHFAAGAIVVEGADKDPREIADAVFAVFARETGLHNGG